MRSETERAFTLARTGAPLTLTATCPAILTDLLAQHGLSEEAADTLASRAWADGTAHFGLLTLSDTTHAPLPHWDGGWE